MATSDATPPLAKAIPPDNSTAFDQQAPSDSRDLDLGLVFQSDAARSFASRPSNMLVAHALSFSRPSALSNIRQSPLVLVRVHVSARAARGDGAGGGRLEQKQDHEVDPSLPEASGAVLSEGAGGQEVPDGEDGRVQENLAGDRVPDGCCGEEGGDLEVPVLSGGGEDPKVQEDVEGGVRPQLVRLRAARVPRTRGQNRHTRSQQTAHSAHTCKSHF